MKCKKIVVLFFSLFVFFLITLYQVHSDLRQQAPQQFLTSLLPSPSPIVLGTTENAKETALVTRVIDGDTIEIQGGQKVRYIGMDTPEIHHPTKGVQCFGQEAAQRNKELVEGKTIQMQKDVSETDRYGRLLRYVWVGDTFINKQLVAEGYAFARSFPPDISKQTELSDAEKIASDEKKGLWAGCMSAL